MNAHSIPSIALQSAPQMAAESRGVKEIDFHSDPRYQRFVASHPEAVIFHNSGWLQSLEREYGAKCLMLATEDTDAALTGVLPLFYTKGMPLGLGGMLGGRRLSSLPRTPVGGPLSLHPAASAALLRSAVEHARSEPGTQLEIKLARPLPAGAQAGLSEVPWRVFYVLDLPRRPEEIRFGNSNRHSQIKRGVDKAIRQGVRPVVADSEAELAAWHDIYARTMQRNGVMARSRRLFEALWDLLRPRGQMRLWLAKRDAKVVAGVLVLGSGSTAFFGYGGWLEGDACAHANDLLHWEAIHEACRMGYRSYDFGEVPDGDAGLARFKAKWNTRAERLVRYYDPAPAAGGSRSGTRVRRFAKDIWRRMPGAAVRQLSDWMYGYL